MRNNKKKKNVIIYFLEMLLVFILLDLIIGLIVSGVSHTSIFYKYGSELISEMFYALAVLIVLLLFKNSYVFTDKKEKFIKGVMLAVPMVFISVFNLAVNVLNLDSFNIANFINVLIFCIFIGIAEEFLCRGWILNEFLERYSGDKKEIITSIVLSALVFGLMHITNIVVQTPFETILQVVNATALGLLLGSVYYKTKNIWSVIFIHAFYDFSIFIGEMNSIKDCTYNTPTLGVTLVESSGTILVSIIWILGTIYVLNKCDFNEYSKKISDKVLLTIMGVLFVLLLVPFERFIPGYDNFMVCYNYNEIKDINDYIIHYPKKDIYTIEYIKDEYDESNSIIKTNYNYSLYRNKNEKIVLKNDNTSYEKEFDYKDVETFELFESKDSFNIVIVTNDNENTVYLSNSLKKENISNENDYLDNITFNEYVFPLLDSVGYLETKDDTYVFLLSQNYDRFIIKDNEALIIKQK